jgi:hypothetical protein
VYRHFIMVYVHPIEEENLLLIRSHTKWVVVVFIEKDDYLSKIRKFGPSSLSAISLYLKFVASYENLTRE